MYRKRVQTLDNFVIKKTKLNENENTKELVITACSSSVYSNVPLSNNESEAFPIHSPYDIGLCLMKDDIPNDLKIKFLQTPYTPTKDYV